METASEVLDRYVRTQMKKGEVSIAGKKYSALDIIPDELEILKEELDAFIDEQNPAVARIIVRGAPRILDAIRLVNYESKQGFKGAAARGHSLVLNPLIVADIYTAGAASAKTSWLVAVTTAGAANWSGDSTNVNNMLVSSLPVLCHVYLGFINPIAVPKSNMIQLIKNGDPMVRECLQWDWRDTFGDNRTPTYELKQPWTIPPGEQYYIAASYFLTGDDKIEPIAFTVKRATDIIAALA